MMPLIVNVGIILLFAILGLVLRAGRGAFLIAGYNTATEEEKEKTDEKKLCKAVGNLFLILATCWILPTVGLATGKMSIFWAGSVLSFAACIIGVVYMNTGNRFEK